MEPIGIGLIGCGGMGRGLAQSLQGVEGARLVAVSDVAEEAGQQAAAEFQVPYYRDYRELLDRQEVQGVIVAAPQFVHAEATVAAAEAGKHIFCEKPMATNVADCDRMIAAAEAAGVKLMIGQVCRFHGVHSTVKRLVAEGVLGQPTCMMVHRLGGGWGQVWRQSWRMSKERSGGTLMEVNAHEIDFLLWVCGEARQVYAAGGNYITPQMDYPDIALITITFRNGAVGFLHSSQATLFGGYGGRLDGTEGSAEFPSIWGENAGVRYRRHDAPEATFLPLSEMEVGNPVQKELAAFITAIRTDTAPPITGRDGRAAVEVAQAAYQSMETGQPVTLPL
jgi:predicted dehydrogenase